MNKQEAVSQVLSQKYLRHIEPVCKEGTYFAPSNIALCKYWGKRDAALNLPHTSSLSISLGEYGAKTAIQCKEGPQDVTRINGEVVNVDSAFAINLSCFLDLFRKERTHCFEVNTEMNIPVGAGLASSACGFAALVGAMDQLYGWQLPKEKLSILARLGSGSACRSFWQGFVEWHKGVQADGMDSVGVPLPEIWPTLRIGLLIVNAALKPISSRAAMERTVLTSPFYTVWPTKQAKDLSHIKAAIRERDFIKLGTYVESNALSMHALMLTAMPAISYSEPSTLAAMQKIWQARDQGLEIYFTQDAGPNLKLLFLDKDQGAVQELFPAIKVVAPYE